MMNLRFIAAAIVGAAGLVAGCAQEVGDIDRVDDNVFEKSMFDGQWYVVQTVTDTNATATTTFAGLQGPLERIYFEFSENYLMGRRVHEDIMGLDMAALNLIDQDIEFDGSLVYAFPVSHVDIQRGYNASTGEQTNTIGTNASDRRWYERDYVFAQWSNNFIETNANMEFAGWIETLAAGQIMLKPEESQGTINVEYNEDDEPYYFDFVTTYVHHTDWWNCLTHTGFPSWGTDCGVEEIAVRTSFLKVDLDNVEDMHVPRRYDDYDMNLFGFFRTNRCYFDPRYECTDFSRVQVANVHDIWTGDRLEDGTPRPYFEREASPIAYYISEEYPIDLIDETYEIAEQFSYAFRRTVAGAQGVSIDEVPRMFYACLNPGVDSGDLPQEWRDVTRNPNDMALLEAAWDASIEGYQNGACERAGEVKAFGDIRYHFFNWRNDPSAPWYGYGPSAADPLTGEIIHGVANFNGGHLNRHAQRILNYVRIIEGDLTPEEYGYGVPIQEYFENLRDRNDYDLYYGIDHTPGGDKDLSELAEVSVDSILRAAANVEENREIAFGLLDDDHLQMVLSQPEMMRMRDGRQADPLAPVVGTAVEQRMMVPEFVEHMSMGAVANASEVEGLRAQGSEDEYMAAMDWMSPVRVARAATIERRYERLRDSWLERNIMMAPDFDRQIIGFAEEIYQYKAYLEETFPELSEEEIEYELWLDIRGRVFTGIQSHEIGHTVGLRHNFIGTADSMNYFPQYWAHRERTFNEDCDGQGYQTFDSIGLAIGEVAPTLCGVDESAEEEAERSAQLLAEMRSGSLEDGTHIGSINHFEYSTVMDYHGDLNGRQGGLGLYDYASLAYGYGELVEVFNEPPHRLEVRSEWDSESGSWDSTTVTRSETETVSDMDDVERWVRAYPGGIVSDVPDDDEDDNRWNYWHYSVLPIMFHDDGHTPAENTALGYHERIDFTGLDTMGRMYDRSLVSASDCHGAHCTSCDVEADCGAGNTCYRNPFDPRQSAGLTRGYCAPVNDAVPLLSESDVHVPYRFCSDHRRGSSALCNIWDGGADEYEVVARILDDYENYYPISSFRRGRPTFGLWLWPYLMGQLRTFDSAIAQYQYWLLNAAGRGPEWYLADQGGIHATIAMQDAVNFVAGVFTTPSVGTYAPDPELDGMLVNVDNDAGYRFESFEPRFGATPETEYVDLTVGDGARYGFSQFYRRREDEQAPFYYFLQYDVLSHFWSKYAAMISFTNGSVNVVGADTASDNTAFYIPPYLAFPDDVANYFGALMSEEFDNFGLCVTRGDDGEAVVNDIEMIRSSSYRCEGQVMNPYTAVYGNRDYNMQLYATLFAAATFSGSLDYSWLNHSSVYVWGRGETPAFINDTDTEFEWVTYTDELGMTYAARYAAMERNPDWNEEEPDEEPEWIPVDPDDYNSDRGPNVGYRMVQRAIDLEVEYGEALDQEILAEEDPNEFAPERTSDEIYFELQNHLETIRWLIEVNKVFQF